MPWNEMRHTEAWSRWQFHEMPMSTPSAHATADFIGDTWLTTTTFDRDARSAMVRTRRAHPCVERGERFTALGHVVRVLLPSCPRPRRHVGVRHPLVLAVGQFDPPLVDLVGHAEPFGRLLWRA